MVPKISLLLPNRSHKPQYFVPVPDFKIESIKHHTKTTVSSKNRFHQNNH